MTFEILVPLGREVDWVVINGLTLPRESLMTIGHLPGQSYQIQSWKLPAGVSEPFQVTINFKSR
jgi:hypothetical protein